MELGFCIEALQEALAKYGPPEIFNTPSRGLQANPCRAVDQGSQFTSYEFTQVLNNYRLSPVGFWM
jgi:putative transposase